MIPISIHKPIPQRKSYFKHHCLLYGEFLWTTSDYRLFGAEHKTSVNLSAALLPVMVPPVLLVMFICSWPFNSQSYWPRISSSLIPLLFWHLAVLPYQQAQRWARLGIVFMVSLATENSKYTFADRHYSKWPIISTKILGHLSWPFHFATSIWVNNCSGNGLLPITSPSYYLEQCWLITWRLFRRKCSRDLFVIWVWKWLSHLTRANELMKHRFMWIGPNRHHILL